MGRAARAAAATTVLALAATGAGAAAAAASPAAAFVAPTLTPSAVAAGGAAASWPSSWAAAGAGRSSGSRCGPRFMGGRLQRRRPRQVGVSMLESGQDPTGRRRLLLPPSVPVVGMVEGGEEEGGKARPPVVSRWRAPEARWGVQQRRYATSLSDPQVGERGGVEGLLDRCGGLESRQIRCVVGSFMDGGGLVDHFLIPTTVTTTVGRRRAGTGATAASRWSRRRGGCWASRSSA